MSKPWGQTLKKSLLKPFAGVTGERGMTIVEIMIAGSIFIISLTAAYKGMDSVLMSRRGDRARLKLREVESFIQNNVWKNVADQAKSSTGKCNTAFMGAAAPYQLFPTAYTALGSVGQFKYVRNTAIFPTADGNAEQTAARARCANSLNPVGPASTAFYSCIVFRKNPAATAVPGSIWFNLSDGDDDTKAFAEVWITYRVATDLVNNAVQCQDFGQVSEAGYVGVVTYSIYIAEKAKKGVGLDAWIFKRLDGVHYASRPY